MNHQLEQYPEAAGDCFSSFVTRDNLATRLFRLCWQLRLTGAEVL